MSLLAPYSPHDTDKVSEKRLQIAGMREKAIQTGRLRVFGGLLRVFQLSSADSSVSFADFGRSSADLRWLSADFRVASRGFRAVFRRSRLAFRGFWVVCHGFWELERPRTGSFAELPEGRPDRVWARLAGWWRG
jgi:hypothetical protein